MERRSLPAEEALVVSEYYGEAVSTVSIFRRLTMDGEVYFCQLYSRVKRRNSYTVAYGDQQYGQIMYYTIHKNKPAAMLKKLVLLPLHEAFLPSKSIIPVVVTDYLEVVGVESIQQKVIFISTSDTITYIAKFPCTLNID